MLGAEAIEGALHGSEVESEILRVCVDATRSRPGIAPLPMDFAEARPPKLGEEDVAQDRQEPRPQIGARLPAVEVADSAEQAFLNQIVREGTVVRHEESEATQPWNLGGDEARHSFVVGPGSALSSSTSFPVRQ
jgi:hypothetical protein